MYYFWRQKSPWKSSFGAFLKLKVIHLCNWLGRQQSGAPRKNLKSRLWRWLEVFSNQKVDRVSEQWKILRTRNVYTTNRCNTQRHFFVKIDVQSFISWIPDADALLFFCRRSYFWDSLKTVFKGISGKLLLLFKKILFWIPFYIKIY